MIILEVAVIIQTSRNESHEKIPVWEDYSHIRVQIQSEAVTQSSPFRVGWSEINPRFVPFSVIFAFNISLPLS